MESRFILKSPQTTVVEYSLHDGFKDSRIQINLFTTTNTFCYGINKQDINDITFKQNINLTY